jgi:hypothetical protein
MTEKTVSHTQHRESKPVILLYTVCPKKCLWLFNCLSLIKNVIKHGSKSQPLQSYLINLFQLFFCPCAPHQTFRAHTILQTVTWKWLNWSWRSACLATPFTSLTQLDFYLWGYMKDFVYQEKSQTWDDLLRYIMDGAVLIRNIHESIWKATRTVLKWAHLCIGNAGGHFEQQAA